MACRGLVGKSEGKRYLKTQTWVGGQHSKNRKAGRTADSSDPGYRDVEGSCEHGYEPLGLIKSKDFLQ